MPKLPQAAWVKSSGRERCGKGAYQASGENQRRRTPVNCLDDTRALIRFRALITWRERAEMVARQ